METECSRNLVTDKQGLSGLISIVFIHVTPDTVTPVIPESIMLMPVFRKNLLAATVLLITPFIAQSKVVTDSLQRQVTIPDDPQRIVLGESRMLYTLALVEEGNPAKRVVGWPPDLRKFDHQTWQRYVQAWPEIADIPLIGNSNFSQLNSEKIISLKPDLVILPVYARMPPDSSSLLTQLAAAHIPVIFSTSVLNPWQILSTACEPWERHWMTSRKQNALLSFISNICN